LPDDVDPAQVEARYTDGVLRVRIARKAALQPRHIAVN
jgi:HSP20 family protein